MSETSTTPLQFDSKSSESDTSQKPEQQQTPASESEQLTKLQLNAKKVNNQIICDYCGKPITETETEISYLLAIENDNDNDEITLLEFLLFHGAEYPAELRLESCKDNEYRHVSISCGELAAKSHQVQKRLECIVKQELPTCDESTELMVGSMVGDVYKILEEMLEFTEGCVVSDTAKQHVKKVCDTQKSRLSAQTPVKYSESHKTDSVQFDLTALEEFYTKHGMSRSVMVHMVCVASGSVKM